MNNTTRLQLIDGPQSGYLEIKKGANVPLNFSISDIRDISSRSGMFSKTIALAGTKNNNNILNNYFDVNIVAGTFDVNKRQKVAIVQNGIILRDNCFMRLLKVKKKQSVDTNIDEWVEYEVQVTDELGDFFKEVGNKELKELDGWDKYKHIYGVDAVVASFDHTVDDGYKYTLPWIPNSQFEMNDLMPGIYAKQIFDRIHSMNGFSYDWATMTDDDTQFDKSILPYAGDKKKLTEEYVDNMTVEAESRVDNDLTVVQLNNMNQGSAVRQFDIEEVIKDKNGNYDGNTSTYTSPFTIYNPNKLNYIVKIKWGLSVYNPSVGTIMPGPDRVSPGTIQDTLTGVRPTIQIRKNGNTINTSNLKADFETFTDTTGGDAPIFGEPVGVQDSNGYLNIRGRVAIPSLGTRLIATGSETIPMTAVNINIGDLLTLYNGLTTKVGDADYYWKVVGSNAPVDVEYNINVISISIEIAPDSQNGLMPGTEIDLKNFLPSKMKQSEFLKTIYQKYNLYVEADPDNPSKLVYTSRDKFYDDGTVKDWTKKLDKKKEQELYFIPDITTKKMILSYKDDDKDSLLSAYRDETSKTFGQVDVTFDNENIKGEERKEEVFSPTINMKTDFDAVLPVLNADFKMNQRILQDGGKLPCQQYSLKESDSKTVTSSFYPHLSMFDKPYNPTFSTEYKQSSFYAYNPGLFTENNLYTKHWRRTLAQINSGKMLKAWFWLTEEDIQNLRMNDKIKINNAYYYINAIIDYDANYNSVTKVELLTVEDGLKLPRIGGGIKDIEAIGEVVDGISRPKVPSRPGGFFVDAISEVIKKRYDESVVVAGPTPLIGNLGMGNTLARGFRGVVIGDNVQPNQDGIFVGENTEITEGGIKSNSLEVPGLTVSEDGDIDFTGLVNVSGDIEVDSIKINNIGTTTPIGNLGYDATGNVVQGINPTTVNSLNILDTRNDNEDPLWYMTNYGRKNVIELKRKTAIGLATLLPTGTFCNVETISQWLDGSGGYPIQIARDPNTGDVAKRWGINDTTWSSWILDSGKLRIVPILYTDLKTLKDNNDLVTGTRYFISDRDIWIDALDTDKLSMSAKRHFRIIKDEFYTPHTVNNGIFISNYLGIYGQTIAKGSVPNSVLNGNRYYAIWGGRYWSRDTSGTDVPGSSDVTIGGGWTMLVTTNNTYYESKVFDIKYDFDEDIIWEQSDDRANVIKRESFGVSFIDITDWGNRLLENNVCKGVFNNYKRPNLPAEIKQNNISGYIARNTTTNFIFRNSNKGNIEGNSVRGGVRYNSNRGDISFNTGLSNTDSYTKTADIDNNSNQGDIINNDCRGVINNNNNSGDINGNVSVYTQSSSTFLDIMNNNNNGYINLNRSTNTTIEIRNNNNNGNIGTTSITNRGSNVTDTIVNK